MPEGLRDLVSQRSDFLEILNKLYYSKTVGGFTFTQDSDISALGEKETL